VYLDDAAVALPQARQSSTVENHGKMRPPCLDGIEGDALPSLICCESPVIQVVAGPGSGKTTGLERRVRWLVRERSVSPSQIFVGTFTRAITAKLAETLGVSFDCEEPGGGLEEGSPQVSTLHSYARWLLHRYPTARRGRSLRFLLGSERDVMLYDIGHKLADSSNLVQRRKTLNRICAAWAEGTELDLTVFLGEMDRWLRRHGGMLIDEVVKLALIALEAGDVLAGQFDHVIVDEYQDLTAAEQRFVESLWSGSGSLAVLGDDNQSIYWFRNNYPDGVSEFAKRWPESELAHIPLPENRRSDRLIVELANAMMVEAGRGNDPMIPKRQEDGELSLVHWPSVDHEVIGLARYVRARSKNEFLILVPRRFIGYRLRDEIGPDARTAFHEEVLDSPLVQARFALASLVADPEDRVALRTLLSFRSDGLAYGPKRNAAAYSTVLDSNLAGEALLNAIATGTLRVAGSGSQHMKATAQRIVRSLAGLPGQCADQLSVLFDAALADELDDPDQRAQARVSLQTIRDGAYVVWNEMGSDDLSGILRRLRYRIATRIPLVGTGDARVRIMTLHGAKGLEADVVMVAGVADQIVPGIVPGEPAKAQSSREEQRRLLYVAVTRAKHELVVSWPRAMSYDDACGNYVRMDGGVFTDSGRRLVRLGKTGLLPNVSERPQPGDRWLRARVG
jgi:DNA helicase-2/ATP-dependent DNA helicase PcrA